MSDPGSGRLDGLERLRRGIMDCDRELIAILRRRLDLVQEIGDLKASLGFPVTDPEREAAVVRRAAELAREEGLDEEPIRNLMWQIMSSSRTRQYSTGGESREQAPAAKPATTPGEALPGEARYGTSQSRG